MAFQNRNKRWGADPHFLPENNRPGSPHFLYHLPLPPFPCLPLKSFCLLPRINVPSFTRSDRLRAVRPSPDRGARGASASETAMSFLRSKRIHGPGSVGVCVPTQRLSGCSPQILCAQGLGSVSMSLFTFTWGSPAAYLPSCQQPVLGLLSCLASVWPRRITPVNDSSFRHFSRQGSRSPLMLYIHADHSSYYYIEFTTPPHPKKYL